MFTGSTQRGSGFSPIRLSPIRLSPLAKVHRTLANIFSGLSPVGESPPYFRQHTPWSVANWREYSGLSPMRLLEFCQLAKVWWTFASFTSN